MARTKKDAVIDVSATSEAIETAPILEQPAQPAVEPAQPAVEPAQPAVEPAQPKSYVTVAPVYGPMHHPFQNIRIDGPTPVEMDNWIEVQIEAGKLTVQGD